MFQWDNYESSQMKSHKEESKTKQQKNQYTKDA